MFVKKKKNKLVHAVRASNQGPARAFGLRLGRPSIDWVVLGSTLPVFWIATSQFNRARNPRTSPPKTGPYPDPADLLRARRIGEEQNPGPPASPVILQDPRLDRRTARWASSVPSRGARPAKGALWPSCRGGGGRAARPAPAAGRRRRVAAPCQGGVPRPAAVGGRPLACGGSFRSPPPPAAGGGRHPRPCRRR